MVGLVLAISALLLALLPTLLYLRNRRAYAPPPPAQPADPGDPIGVSLLIPARNEEASIGQAVQAALASRGLDRLEILVLDDHSEDATARIVTELSHQDTRVRLIQAPELPPDWCGKQHACHVLAQHASEPLLVFLDADVRLAPDGLNRMVWFQRSSQAALVSGVPHQETVGLLEQLVIPLIHFILLGFLPMDRMRASRQPGLAAGCGQLFLAERSAYETMGGHTAVRASLHDGVTLPRAFRRAGFQTDLCDATDVASCRMYRGPRALWNGLAKNAVEGLASPRLIGLSTVLLLGGQVLPFVLVILAVGGWITPAAGWVAAAAVLVAYVPRFAACGRFRQSWIGALLHPVGVLVFEAIQWYAFTRWLLGRPAGWKGRGYTRPSPLA